MTHPARPLLLVLGALGVLLHAPSGAGAVSGASGSGSRWAAVTVQDAEGGQLTSRMVVTGASSPLVLSARVYEEGERVSTTNLTLRAAGGDQGLALEAPDVAGLNVEVDETEDDSAFRLGEVSVTVTVNPDGPARRGRLSVLLYAAATTVERWEWQADTARSAALLGTSHGPEAFVYSAEDFGGSDVSARATYTAAAGLGARARLNSGSSRSIALDPRFVGNYATFGTDRLRVTGPGLSRDCTPSCDFDPGRPGSVRHSGVFTFSLDGSSVGLRAPQGLSVADTDVSLHGALARPPAGRF